MKWQTTSLHRTLLDLAKETSRKWWVVWEMTNRETQLHLARVVWVLSKSQKQFWTFWTSLCFVSRIPNDVNGVCCCTKDSKKKNQKTKNERYKTRWKRPANHLRKRHYLKLKTPCRCAGIKLTFIYNL